MSNRFIPYNGFIRSRQAKILSSALHDMGNRETGLILEKSVPKTIKVMRIISRLNIGGPAIHVTQLTNGLNPETFESILITGKISNHEGDMAYLLGGSDPRTLVVPELQREIQLFKDIVTFFKILRFLFKEKPHILHTHAAKAGIARLPAFVYTAITGIKVKKVHTFHGNVFMGYFSKFKSSLFVAIERALATITDTVVAISDSQKEDLEKKYKIAARGKIRKIELGFDLEPFLFCAERQGAFRRQLGLPEDALLVGIVGRLVPIKNHQLFIEAAKILKESFPENHAHFVVVGDGELRSTLEAMCRHFGLEEHVVFTGWKKDLSEIYADIDILALSSLNEGTPVSIIEAMAASVPVVATHAGGVKDLLGSNRGGSDSDGVRICERGILCVQHNPVAFADALERQIRSTVSERSQRLHAARDYVVQRYSLQRLINDIENLYFELMKSDGNSVRRKG